MCDIESYVYMPLLEETGYIPTKKYVSGRELREHADRIAKIWHLDQIAWFRQRVTSTAWDDDNKEWVTRVVPQLQSGEGPPISIRSRFVFLATGLIYIPHVPQIPGIEKFKGACFHTARWDYKSTGGSGDNPQLTKLKNQRVGFIGTGATAIQAVPALVPWAKEVYVFQRTPSSVDRRDNAPTDPEWADMIRAKKGWQAERRNNFHAFVTNEPNKPSVNMVNDGWTRFPSYSTMVGGPDFDCRTPEEIDRNVKRLQALDLPRQEMIRKRVDEIVKDPSTADKLKPWYSGWCKRPCYHDEYLQSFNEPHVTLVDTDGRGVQEITEDSVVVGGKEYKIDTLVLSTGYRNLFSSPNRRVDIDVTGRNGLSFDDKWDSGITTLHGMMTHDFPNLFWPGLSQSGGSINFVYAADVGAVHIAEIMSHAVNKTGKRAGGDTYKYNCIIEPTADAEEEWSQLVASQAGAFAAMAGCTPGYFNEEGKADKVGTPEEQQKKARGGIWALGPTHFAKHIGDWRATGEFKGLAITPI
jgi:cation diffusion facilitator CzcD-associated flavoprotein CzcO